MSKAYVALFDGEILDLLRKATGLGWRRPRQAFRFLRILVYQAIAQRRRARLRKKEGLQVPPVLIASVTARCNLACKGCYSRTLHRDTRDMTDAQWLAILREAQALGTAIVLVAGGEPWVRPGLLDLLASLPNVVFPVFTNGLLLDDAMIARLRKVPNVIPVFSLEGLAAETDDRRGEGVFENVMAKARSLTKAGGFFGVSFTVTTENESRVASEEVVGKMVAAGCGLFFLVEYVPIDASTEKLALTPPQRERFYALTDRLRERYPALFVAFPGDERKYGGCLAAGRGFVHVNPSGLLEACPFAPYSDQDLTRTTLREGLNSRALAVIRENHHLLTETSGGCALWQNRAQVEALLAASPKAGASTAPVAGS